jgi:HK97 family phage prohead protease
MKLQFNGASLSVDASNGDGPRISGIAVPYNVDASVSTGQTVRILEGALPTDGRMPRLVLEHDTSRVVGVVDQRQDTPEGMLFSARIADTAEGRDLIALLKMGALDSVSVGIMATQHEQDGRTMVIKSATWEELSVVYQAAFEGALITEIAASKDADEPQPLDISQEEQTMSHENPTVEASAEIVPTAPIVFAQARAPFKLPTAAEYVAAQLAGGVKAAEFNSRLKAAAPDVVTGDLDGILPLPIVQPVYNSLIGRRNLIDALGPKAMPQGGKVFIRPSVTTHTTIGISNGENVPLDSGTFVVTDNQVTKSVYGGFVQLSEEAQDWSQPEVLGLILDDMGREYAKQTESAAEVAFEAAITAEEALTDAEDPAAWAAFVWNASQTVLEDSSHLPTHLFVDPSYWAALGQLCDEQGRPLFPQMGPMNAVGSVTPGNLNGMAFGLSVCVLPYLPSGFVAVGNADGFEVFEQMKGAIATEAADGSLSRYIKWRGYFATLMIDANKFVKREV